VPRGRTVGAVSERAVHAPAAVARTPAAAAVTWRVPSRADVPAWLEFVQQVQRFDGDEVMGAEELAASFDDSTWAPERDARLLSLPDATLAGDAVVGYNGPSRDAVRIHLWGGVRPELRGRGLGRQVLDWQLVRGAERYAELDTDLPGRYEVGCVVGGSAERLFIRYGFGVVRYWSHMAHPLDGLARPAAQADGLRVMAYREELFEQVRRAHNEAFADHWGSTLWDGPTWKERAVGHPSFRPELSYVVLDGTRRDPTVAAYVLSYENEAEGTPTGYIGQVGTRRPWRGRGLGSTLVCTTLAAMKKAGYGRAALTVDAGNPTGAQDLYERLGFVTERQNVSYQRPIGPPPST
jgi:mycothiol synthase